MFDFKQSQPDKKEECSTEKWYVGRDVRCLSRKIARSVFSTCAHRKIDEMTSSNGWVIAYIGDHPDQDVFQRDLEKEFGITRSTASKNIDLLEQKGFIERRRVDYDARLKKLVLTKKAEDILAIMKSNRELLESKLTAGFTDEEISTLCSYIQRLMANLETDPEEKT
ncbi:MAG: MarR family winged helix-turn-helix transcriptional regulator [Oscillospiraceae bacterium]